MNHSARYFIMVIFVVLAAAGCRKEEFLPPPEGAKVPYKDPGDKSLDNILKESSYKLFYKTWKQSSLDTLLTGKTPYTLLVPDDAVMQAAGYTDAVIGAMLSKDADSLVMFFTSRGQVTKEGLAAKSGSYYNFSLLPRPGLMVPTPNSQSYIGPYFFAQNLAIQNGKLLVNGVVSGDAAAAIPASNGYIWPITRMPAKPDKGFWEVLETDPRFTMLMEVIRRSDSIYNATYRQVYYDAVGWDPGDNSDRGAYQRDLSLPTNQYTAVRFNTLFAPTDEAFHQAGFQSVDEILEWNKRGPEMYFDMDTYTVKGGGFPSDTIVNYHLDWGRANQFKGAYGWNGTAPTLFYINDLNDNLLSNYVLNSYYGTPTYLMPFHYGKDANDHVQVQIKGTDYPAATITETIQTLSGPLHVMDRLLIPKDFKLK